MSVTSLAASAPRIELAHLPTPLEPLERLTAALGGPEVWVKRDDCTGLGIGGNKVRKLEYVMADAVAAGADTVIGVGVPQSNAVRQTAAAAARLGLGCHLLLLTGRVPGTGAEYETSGNVLLDRLLGASVEFVPWQGGDVGAEVKARVERLEAEGRRPYPLPYGISNGLGALGYARFAVELAGQLEALRLGAAAVVMAAGSGGTQAGAVLGMREVLPDTGLVGIDVDAEPDRVRGDVLAVAAELAALAGVAEPDPATVEVVAGYAGPGYGVPTDGMVEAVRTAARLEGLLLDPVYTGKAFAGMLDLVRQGRWGRGDRVVFVHTGGTPALFAYRAAFDGA
jgi:L-cysteate sulfo-lyase